jgi:hypothetical protein
MGTLDELGDLLSLKQNGFIGIPIVLVNLQRYFDPLLAWLAHARKEGFLYGGRLMKVARTPAAAISALR